MDVNEGRHSERRTGCVVIAGVGMKGDGYPNAENTLRLLISSGLDVQDRAYWLPPETRLWQLARAPALRRLGMCLRLVAMGLLQAMRAVMAGRKNPIYLPYPAPITLIWLSLVPSWLRPSCIADAYISLWDSMFRDRGAASAGSPASRSVRWFERRSLRAASLVLTDTEASKAQLVSDFDLDPGRVRSLPLAINDQLFRTRRCGQLAGEGRLGRVLFVGTLVPLHGVEVLLKAADHLREDANVEFRLLGDGQQSGLVENFLARGAPENFTWVRGWKTLEQVAAEIAEADLCLGVFGGAAKASRVLPFKLYYALAAGKAIVTQSEYSLPAGVPRIPAEFVRASESESASEELAHAIRILIQDGARRAALGQAARAYFERHLSSHALLTGWAELLADVGKPRVSR